MVITVDSKVSSFVCFPDMLMVPVKQLTVKDVISACCLLLMQFIQFCDNISGAWRDFRALYLAAMYYNLQPLLCTYVSMLLWIIF